MLVMDSDLVLLANRRADAGLVAQPAGGRGARRLVLMGRRSAFKDRILRVAFAPRCRPGSRWPGTLPELPNRMGLQRGGHPAGQGQSGRATWALTRTPDLSSTIVIGASGWSSPTGCRSAWSPADSCAEFQISPVDDNPRLAQPIAA